MLGAGSVVEALAVLLGVLIADGVALDGASDAGGWDISLGSRLAHATDDRTTAAAAVTLKVVLSVFMQTRYLCCESGLATDPYLDQSEYVVLTTMQI